MEQIRDVTETSWLKSDNFLLLPFSFKSVNNLGHVLSRLSQLSVRQEFIVVDGTAEVGGITLNFLQIDVLNVIDDKGELHWSIVIRLH